MKAGVERLTYRVPDLAQTLGISEGTIYQYSSRCPERLPPRLNTPFRTLLWDVEEVKKWLKIHRT